jgi:hypothetical protein
MKATAQFKLVFSLEIDTVATNNTIDDLRSKLIEIASLRLENPSALAPRDAPLIRSLDLEKLVLEEKES